MTDYLTLEYLNNSLGIVDNDEDEPQFLQIISDSNIEVDKVLIPYAEKIPIPPNTDLFEQGRILAMIYAHSRWFRDTGQLERSEKSSEEYDKKKDSLIETLRSNRTTRTRRATVGTLPQTRKLFSQVKRY